MKHSKYQKPFVKWAGGKQGLAKTLAKYFPNNYKTYYEPFLGGGSVLLAVSPGNAVISDENDWLIECYRAIRDDWKAVVRALDKLVNTRDEFYKVRAISPSSLDLAQKAANFIYLNKTCFRGLYRVNQKGQFNVPYGEYDRRYYDPANLETISDVLSNFEIRNGDFENGLNGITKNDFAYLDPPYYKIGGYSDFNRYTSSKFLEPDHIRLASLCRELDAKRVKWALSNSDTKLIRWLFKGFKIYKLASRREINLNSSGRDIHELLITNY